MAPKKRKPAVFASLCVLYGLLCLLGYVLFAESQWARQVRSSSVWTGPLLALESWVKGFERQNSQSLKEESFVMIGEIRGEDALLVRDFSSLVFRSAHENELLTGRNVLLTKGGVHARLWLVDYDSWLELQPNTLIVLDRAPSGKGDASVLNLSVLAGAWQLKEVLDSDVESLKSPDLRESVKSRREMRRVASQDRNPSSSLNKDAQLPGIQIQDFVKMREYESLDAGVVSEGKEIVALAQRSPEPLVEATSPTTDASLEDQGVSFWGTSASIEGAGLGASLNNELRALAKVLETSDMATVSSDETAVAIVEDAQLVEVSEIEAPLLPDSKGSLKGLDRVLVAETHYISSAIKARDGRRSPAASAIGLSLALERASSYGKAQDLNPALSQVLSDYLTLYLARGECGMVNELYENVQKNFAPSSTRKDWELGWVKGVEASQCKTLLQAQNRSSLRPEIVKETHYIQKTLDRKRSPSSDSASLEAELKKAGDPRVGSAFNEALGQVLDAQMEEGLAKGDCQRAAEIFYNVQKSYEENTILLNWKAKWSQNLENRSCIK